MIVKINEFISVCLQLIQESGKIIKQINDEKSFNKIQKKDDKDFVTDADIKAQDLIIKGLRQFWPDLQIIGEEDVQPQIPWEFDFQQIKQNILISEFFNENEFKIEESIVWIDPLDGTLSFLKGELNDVTTLIGLSVNKKPYIGIIGQHYQLVQQKYEYDPIIYFSQLNHKNYYIYERDLKKQTIIPYEMKKPKLNKNRKIIASSTHRMNDKLDKQIQQFNPTQIVKVGGAGNKLLQISKGIIDMYYLPKPFSLKRWDTCAGEVFIKNHGGFVMGIDGQEYDYVKDEDYSNRQGIVAVLNKEYLL